VELSKCEGAGTRWRKMFGDVGVLLDGRELEEEEDIYNGCIDAATLVNTSG